MGLEKRDKGMTKFRQTFFFLCFLLWLPVMAQDSPSPTPKPNQAFALHEIASQLETTESTLTEIRALIDKTGTLQMVENGLEGLVQQVDQMGPEVARKLAQGPSLNELRGLDSDWAELSKPISGWRRSLATRSNEVGVDRLTTLRDAWLATLAQEGSGDLPGELQEKIQAIVEQLEASRSKAVTIRDRIQLLLTRIHNLESRLETTASTLARAREQRVQQLLLHDSAAIWQIDFRQLALGGLPYEIRQSLRVQLRQVGPYFDKHGERFLLHILTFGLLVLSLRWMRGKVQGWFEREPTLKRSAEVFSMPFSSGLLMAMFLSPWFYPQPPTILSALLGTTALVPACLVLRRMLERTYHLVLYGLVFLFLIDQLRAVLASQILLSRLVFTVEVGACLLYLAWQVKFHPVSNVWHQRLRMVAAGSFGFAFLVANFGFVSLGYLVGDATLHSAYLAMLLFCLVRILDGWVVVALRTPPLALLNSVRNYRPRFRKVMTRAIRVLAVLLWCWHSLDFLSIRPEVVEGVGNFFAGGLRVGAISITLGGMVGLALALWLPYKISRFARFVLEEDVYPRVHFTKGASYTFSTLIHYVLLVGGGLFGLAALGVDTTKFTIVAGALGVGIGFGLQNIVNNFVSGLILLFERPIEVGHVIEISGQVGTLQRIGLRASVLRTPDGSEVIVPNGELLSTRVTNWTLSNATRMLRIPVGVAYGSSVQQVTDLLRGLAEAHPDVLETPAPVVIFQELADNSLNFELRAWTGNFSRWAVIRSELLTSVYEALNEAGIGIPFPQRTLHIESWPAPPESGQA